MSLLQKLQNGPGYLKAGFLGFQGSGKTWTSMLLAIGTREHMKQTGPIAMFDTEGGSDYIQKNVESITGQALVGVKSRAFDDLMTVTRECIETGVSVLIVDSVTHIWREVCEAYLKEINDARRRQAEEKNWSFKSKKALEFQDWSHVKSLWSKWTDLYLNAPLNIIIAGRAGFEYDMQTNEDTNKKELIKTGIKMKTESEFGFEPSLLVEMEREQVGGNNGTFDQKIRATVIKDRFNLINGSTRLFQPNKDRKTELKAVMDFFSPHISQLIPKNHSQIDTQVKTFTGADEEGNTEWAREKKTRTILSEEIQGILVAKFPGQDAESKKTKAELLFKYFNTRSWTAIENMSSERLRDGLSSLKAELEPPPPDTAPEGAIFSDQGNLVPQNGKGAPATVPALGEKETATLKKLIHDAKSKASKKAVQDMVQTYYAQGDITEAQHDELVAMLQPPEKKEATA